MSLRCHEMFFLLRVLRVVSKVIFVPHTPTPTDESRASKTRTHELNCFSNECSIKILKSHLSVFWRNRIGRSHILFLKAISFNKTLYPALLHNRLSQRLIFHSSIYDKLVYSHAKHFEHEMEPSIRYYIHLYLAN